MGKLTRKEPYPSMPDISGAWRFREIYDRIKNIAILEFHDLDAEIIVKWQINARSLTPEKRKNWKNFNQSPVSWIKIPPSQGNQTTIIFALDRNATLTEEIWNLKRTQRINKKKIDKVDLKKFTYFQVKREKFDIRKGLPTLGGPPTSTFSPQRFKVLSPEKPVNKEAKKEKFKSHPLIPKPETQQDKLDKLLNYDWVYFKPKVIIWRCQSDYFPLTFGQHFSYNELYSDMHIVVPWLKRKTHMVKLDNFLESPLSNAHTLYHKIINDTPPTSHKHIPENEETNQLVNTAYFIQPSPEGISIQHIEDEYFVSLKIKDKYKGAAFNYEISHKDAQKFRGFKEGAFKNNKTILKVIHDHNIVTHGYNNMYKHFNIDHKEVLSPKGVPKEGFVPANRYKTFEELKISKLELINIRDERVKNFLHMGLDIVISFIPFIGALYDLGQLALILSTGKNIYGDKVDGTGLAVLGLATSLGFALRGSKILKEAMDSGDYPVSAQTIEAVSEHLTEVDEGLEALGAIENSKKTNKKTSKKVNDELKDQGKTEKPKDPKNTIPDEANDGLADLKTTGHLGIDSVSLMTPDTQKLLLDLFRNRNLSPKEILAVLETLAIHLRRSDSIASNIPHKLVDKILYRQAFLKLFKKNGKQFRNSSHNAYYEEYLKGTKDAPPLSALDWLLKGGFKKRKKGGVVSHVVDDFVEIFGADYKQILRQIIEEDGKIIIPDTFNLVAIKNLKKIFKKTSGVRKFKNINIDRQKLEDSIREIFEHFLEVDHILGKRFFYNLPDAQKEIFDHHNELLSILIPKNSESAEIILYQMNNLPKKKAVKLKDIGYIHNEKTYAIANLIKNGKESEYTVQQIADALLFTLNKLDALDPPIDPNRIMKDLEKLHEIRALNGFVENLPVNRLSKLSEDSFQAGINWPDP